MVEGRTGRARILTAAILAAFVLAGCQRDPQQQARSEEYFNAHIAEARKLVAACTSGSERGPECENAHLAVDEADRKADVEKALADAKAHGGGEGEPRLIVGLGVTTARF